MDDGREPRARTIEDALPPTATTGRENLLVVGRSAELMQGLFEAVIAPEGSDADGVVVGSTRAPPSLVANRYGLGSVDETDGRLGVVDCSPSGAGIDVGPDRLRWTVPGPTDLRASSIALSECLETLGRRGVDRRHLVFDSLSTVLRSVDTDDVLQFAHGICVANDGREGLGLFPVYAPSTDARDIERLKTVFDGLVEVRAAGAAREVRVRGFPDASDGWVTVGDGPASRNRAD